MWKLVNLLIFLCLITKICYANNNFTEKYINDIKSISKKISTNCDKIFPAVIQMAFGIDVTTLDIIGADSGQSSLPVIEFTCNNGNKQSIGSEIFDIPDSVSMVKPILGSINLRFNTFDKTTFDLKKSIENCFSFEANLIFDSFTASASYLSSSELILSQQRSFGIESSIFSGYRATFNPYELWALNKPKMNKQLQGYYDYALSKITEFNETVLDVFQYIFDNWHTHYIQNGCYGAMLGTTWATSQHYISIFGEENTFAEAENDFLFFVKASGGYYGDTRIQSQDWLSATIRTTITIGGKGIPTPDSFFDWSTSGLYYPHLTICDGEPIKLIPLSVLMDKKIGNLFDIATTNYYDHVAIQKYILPTLAIYSERLINIGNHIKNDKCNSTIFPPECGKTGALTCSHGEDCGCVCDISADYCDQHWTCSTHFNCCSRDVNPQYSIVIGLLTNPVSTLLITINALYADATKLNNNKIISHADLVLIANRFVTVSTVMQTPLDKIACTKEYKHQLTECGMFPYGCGYCNQPHDVVCPLPDHLTIISEFEYPIGLLTL